MGNVKKEIFPEKTSCKAVKFVLLFNNINNRQVHNFQNINNEKVFYTKENNNNIEYLSIENDGKNHEIIGFNAEEKFKMMIVDDKNILMEKN